MRWMKLAVSLSCILALSIFCASAEPQAKKAEAQVKASGGGIVQKVFKVAPVGIAPETQKDLTPTVKAGFAIEAGGDTFKAYFALDAVRYEYQGEWYEWEALDHNLVAIEYDGGTITLSNFWADTDMRLIISNYGVKNDIILKSDKAPRSFSFAVSKSAGWEKGWIREAVAYDSTGIGDLVPVETAFDGDELTYTLPANLSGYEFPIILDPTFEVGGSVDDTYSMVHTTASQNNYTANSCSFGRYDNVNLRRLDGLVRFGLDIPIGATITTAKLRMKARATRTGSFNTTVYGLEKDNKWETSTGFHTDNYAGGYELRAISLMSTSVAWNNVESWTVDQWYYSPEIKTILQDQIDDETYDPEDSEDKYVAYRIYEGDGDFLPLGENNDSRGPASYDADPDDAIELEVTYTTPGTPQVINYIIRR